MAIHSSSTTKLGGATTRYLSVVVGLMVLLGVIGGVYYTYVSNQRIYFTERNFRILATQANQLKGRFRDYQYIFESAGNRVFPIWASGEDFALMPYHQSELPCVKASRTHLQKFQDIVDFLCRISAINQVVLDIPPSAHKSSGRAFSLPPAQQNGEKQDNSKTMKMAIDSEKSESQLFSAYLKKQPEGWLFVLSSYLHTFVQGQGGGSRPGRTDPGFSKTLLGEVLLGQLGKLRIQAKVQVSRVMEEILYGNNFQNVLLADNRGRVIYQRDSSKFLFSSLNSLLSNDNEESKQTSGDEAKKFAGNSGENLAFTSPNGNLNLTNMAPSLHEVTLADEKVLIFLQPVDLAALTPNSLVILGIVPSSQFFRETLKVPYSILLGLIFLLFVLLIGLPFLKLLIMGPKDRFTKADFILLLFSSFIGTALLTFFLLDLFSFVSAKKDAKEQLVHFSKNVRDNFNQELGRILAQLVRFDKSKLHQLDLKYLRQNKFACTFGKSRDIKNGLEKCVEEETKVTSLRGSGGSIPTNATVTRPIYSQNVSDACLLEQHHSDQSPSSCEEFLAERYPFFSSVFWVNPDGVLKFAWRDIKFPVQVRSLKEREYVKNIKTKKAWHIKFPPFWIRPIHRWDYVRNIQPKKAWHIKFPPREFNFWVQPIYTWDSGLASAVVSLPSPVDSYDTTSSDLSWVVAMETQLYSLMNPVIKRGFGYAIVDIRTGEMQFHSELNRNLRENFLAETDNNSQLRALLLAGGTGHVDGKYEGNPHKFYVTTLERSLPWGLVVFMDMQALHTTNLEALTLAIWLLGIYLGVVLFILLVVFLILRFLRIGFVDWMWPDERRLDDYTFLIYFHLALLLVFAVLLFSGGVDTILIYSLLLLPVLGIPILVATLRWELGRKFRQTFNSSGKKKTLNMLKEMVIYLLWGAPLQATRAYPLLMMTFLVVYAMVPAIGFFKVSWEAEANLGTRSSQWQFVRSFIQRNKATSDYYNNQEKIMMPNLKTRDGILKKRLAFPNESKGGNCINLSSYSNGEDGKTWDNYWGFIQDDKALLCQKYKTLDAIQESPNRETHILSIIHPFLRVPYDQEYVQTHGFLEKFQKYQGFSLEPNKLVYEVPHDSSVSRIIRIESPQNKFRELPIVLVLSVGFFIITSLSLAALKNFIKGVIPPNYHKEVVSPAIIITILLSVIILWIPFIFFEMRTIFLKFPWIIFLAIYVALLYQLPRFISKRVFLLGFNKPIPQANLIPSHFDTNLLIIKPPTELSKDYILKWKEKPEDTEFIQLKREGGILRVLGGNSSKYQPIDLEDYKNEGWLEDKLTEYSKEPAAERIVVLAPFEFQLDRTDLNQGTLLLLETLLQWGWKIWIVSSAHPMEVASGSLGTRKEVGGPETPVTDKHQWAKVFRSFVTIYFSDSPEEKESFEEGKELKLLNPSPEIQQAFKDEYSASGMLRNIGKRILSNDVQLKELQKLPDEPRSKGIIEMQAMDLARSYYQFIWATCSDREKLTLFHLAKDGFLNSAHPELPSLLQKNLIKIDKNLRLMNKSFRNFVLEISDEENVVEFETRGPTSLWRKYALPIGIVLLVVGVGLIATQDELREGLLSIPALLPVVLALPKLISLFQGGKSGTPAT